MAFNEKTVALGTKIFSRAHDLEALLESIPSGFVDHLYVADDGESSDKKQTIYDAQPSGQFTLIDLEYDAGLGSGRRRIVEECNEDFLLIVDPDHRIPETVARLTKQLHEKREFGGIAGSLIEPKQGRFYTEAQDFVLKNGNLMRGPRVMTTEKEVEIVAGNPLVEFDCIANAAMFRREALEDYCWDCQYVIHKEHVDFYMGHWMETEWKFGINPAIVFEHYPGGDETYDAERFNDQKHRASREYFLKKWNLESDSIERWTWFDSGSPTPTSFAWAKEAYQLHGPRGLLTRIIDKFISTIR